ncbi:NUDIX hydrolase [Clostridium chauvoei]|uniref:NUDIX hydrolase n=2 Tax=Clostridium chauvoei TaxID=46867 RepID=A0ABD4RF78_9CLOT|nr:NUDIX hydrolase [Clostridium chauvoei]ATD54360.1 NUDIX hydrolase [Clostridium chauvoei]ATD57956.1 NUDIX hydrolase [Clostridium chauvoei]MBX7279750.1 NUDIX hydrolase [Clostridium chauvoei]MBX7282119.1 NUDIX hydrolase [Clostridium chauvoei]MBX7284641.1 NUDIX hydrolase [Clostridium chauvoei]
MNWINSIKNYTPYNEQEKKDKELILSAIENYNNLLTRENVVMHMTSSGYIVNKNRDKVLMIYHKIYNSWAWTGGHADGDDDMLYIAIKEAKEETGLKNVTAITPDIFSLDVLTVNGHVKRGNYVSSHLHLNVTYLLEADENEALIVNKEETEGVKWLPINELSKYCSEEYMIENVYNKLNKKINLL